MNHLSRILFAGGAMVVAIAAGWWWMTYGDVIGYDYISLREASVCLVGESTICHLARALCRGTHPASIIAYSAATFWVGIAALSASLIRFAPDRRGVS